MSALLNNTYATVSVNMQALAEPIEIGNRTEAIPRANSWVQGLGTVAILWLALMVSGITLVYSKHVMRQKVSELQALQENWDHMQVEWHRMLLEQSTRGGLNRIEREATEQLGMKIPEADSVVIVKKH